MIPVNKMSPFSFGGAAPVPAQTPIQPQSTMPSPQMMPMPAPQPAAPQGKSMLQRVLAGGAAGARTAGQPQPMAPPTGGEGNVGQWMRPFQFNGGQ
jgi:hypothetical protein